MDRTTLGEAWGTPAHSSASKRFWSRGREQNGGGGTVRRGSRLLVRWPRMDGLCCLFPPNLGVRRPERSCVFCICGPKARTVSREASGDRCTATVARCVIKYVCLMRFAAPLRICSHTPPPSLLLSLASPHQEQYLVQAERRNKLS